MVDFLEEHAQMNKVSVNELIGIITKQMNYHTEKRNTAIDIADKLIKGDQNSSTIPMPIICYLQQSLQLGRSGYQLLKTVLRNSYEELGVNSVQFPSWKNMRQYQKSIIPTLRHDTDLPGVRLNYSN